MSFRLVPNSVTLDDLERRNSPNASLILGKASTIGIEISPTPPLIFTGVKKCKIWRRFQHHSNLSRPNLKMQQDIRTVNQISCVFALYLRQVW